jgi:hypothetical protein
VFTDEVRFDLLVEVLSDQLEPLVRQKKLDLGQLRHPALIFDEAKSFAEE